MVLRNGEDIKGGDYAYGVSEQNDVSGAGYREGQVVQGVDCPSRGVVDALRGIAR